MLLTMRNSLGCPSWNNPQACFPSFKSQIWKVLRKSRPQILSHTVERLAHDRTIFRIHNCIAPFIRVRLSTYSTVGAPGKEDFFIAKKEFFIGHHMERKRVNKVLYWLPIASNPFHQRVPWVFEDPVPNSLNSNFLEGTWSPHQPLALSCKRRYVPGN